MAASVAQPDDTGPQPKAVMNYRRGGDHCGVCMHFTSTGASKGTCTKVTPPDVDAGDLCDAFTEEWDAYDDSLDLPDDPDEWRDQCDDPSREDFAA